MDIQLSEHFDNRKLFHFSLPSIAMMIFTSIYSIVDGIFVSNFVGKTQFAAINLIMPLLMIFSAIGFMLGTGGSALVAKTLGEGDRLRANRIFSNVVYTLLVLAIGIAAVSLIFLRDISLWLGAEGKMLDYCVVYGRILLPALPAFMLQTTFMTFLVTAERPNFGLYITLAVGVGNMILDAVFILVFGWELEGAAWATVIAQIIGGILPLIYFLMPNKSLLRLTRAPFDGKAVLRASTNGISEFFSNISMSVVAIIYNWQLMRLVGEDGVAAFGVIQYVNFIFLAVFLGFGIGTAPIIGYNYGAGRHVELQNVYRRSLRFIGVSGLLLFIFAEIFAFPLASIFVGYDKELLSLTTFAFRLYGISFLLAGFNIYASALFTALNNGLVSAVIACGRTLLCETVAVIVIPLLFGIDGIWLAITFAETGALLLTTYCLKRYKAKYNY